jgi:hypothetical protein
MPNTNLLNWRTLTAASNERKTPASFIKRLLFGREVTVPTKNIELSKIVRGRKMAPFVKRNSVAVKTSGHEESFRIVTPPHIKTVHDFTPGQLMDQRRVGTDLYVGGAEVAQTMALRISEALQYQNDDIDNRIEWMCAQLLTGSLSYEAPDQVAFEIDLDRDTDHTIDVGAGSALYWDENGSKPSDTFLAVQRLLEQAVSLQATHVILGEEATNAFLGNASVLADLDPRRLVTGNVDLTTQLQDSGALYLGMPYRGVQIWSYTRQVEDETGTMVSLIRSKYAEFVCATPAAEAVIYYGAIEDMRAIGEGRLLMSKRFSKSWDTEDPSAKHISVQCNPLPFLQRPEATVSCKVVSG